MIATRQESQHREKSLEGLEDQLTVAEKITVNTTGILILLVAVTFIALEVKASKTRNR